MLSNPALMSIISPALSAYASPLFNQCSGYKFDTVVGFLVLVESAHADMLVMIPLQLQSYKEFC